MKNASVPLIGIAVLGADRDILRALLAGIEAPVGAAIVVLLSRGPAGADGGAEEFLADHPVLTGVTAQGAHSLEPDRVYLVPADRSVTLDNGTLSTQERTQGGDRAVAFFGEIARAAGTLAVGVSLSDNPQNAAAGLEAIREAGGITLSRRARGAAQGESAADLTGDVSGLVRELQAIARHLGRGGSESATDLHDFLSILRDETGHDFRDYKLGTLGRRIGRRMSINRITQPQDYAALLRDSAQERAALVTDLLIGVTQFLRDPAVWAAFAEQAIDAQIADLSEGDTIRAWAAGCATGEEAYSLAMLLNERIEASGKQIGVQVFASDLSAAAIAIARQGRYSGPTLKNLSQGRLERWFRKDGDDYRVTPALRDCVVFAHHNVLSDPPFSSVHLMVCRNLLIYLDRETQVRLFDTFHFALTPGGRLLLGQAENADAVRPLFEVEDMTARIYRRKSIRDRDHIRISPARATQKTADQPRIGTQLAGDNAAVRSMLARFVPPGVLVTEEFKLVSLHGEVSGYLGLDRGGMTANVLDMVSERFRAQAWYVLQTARREDREVQTETPTVNEAGRPVRLMAQPLTSKGERYFLLYFLTEQETAAKPERTPAEDAEIADRYLSEIRALQKQLEVELEKGNISTEELQTAHEEILSANEELQSSNEELESSRAELHTLNEELAGTNNQLVDKISELEATNDDLLSLINSTDTPTVFLDTDLNIRRFSARTTALLRIRPGDIGRPLGDLVSRVDDPTLEDDLRRVIDMPQTIECEVSGEGSTYLRRVAPYYTRKNVLQGVIVTYADVSRLRDYAEKLKRQAAQQSSVVTLGRLALESEDIESLFNRACSDLAGNLGAEMAAVMRHNSAEDAFLLEAGTGWPRGLVGRTLVPASNDNEFAFALGRSDPTVIADMSAEPRITRSELIRDVSAQSGLCVPVGPVGSRWGLLSLFWKTPHTADADEILYASSVSSVLWLAVSQAETKQLRDKERAALQELIDGLPILIAVVGADMTVDLFNDSWEDIGFTSDETQNCGFGDLLGEEAAAICTEIVQGRRAVPREGVEFSINVPGKGARTHLIYCVPRETPGDTGGFFFAALDIHERKTSEERNRVISAELDHRVKNVLALVDTIARMTSRKATSLAQFREDFSNRVHSLARTHTHLAAENWDGMDLRRLIAEELEAFAPTDTRAYSIEGPQLILGPTATQSFALAMHELVTNAAKYGALSVPDATLSVRWQLANGMLDLHWSEKGTGPLSQPEGNGFGTTVVTNAIKNQLGGRMTAAFGETGLEIDIEIPLKNLSAGDTDDL
ncbi:CheR family methyltransferase [Sulfitobacter sp. HNIBRBA3233]|uniref:CheR family methyltransferase n=1 Tax=Sulfitobacter marinivivus TaxID=3158558 RepID=UPI0032DF2B6E